MTSQPDRDGARARRVVVIGGGASGALTAVQLLRHGDARLSVTIVEPSEELAKGAAFSTRDPWHRLNVPAVTMSAFPGDPDHFRAWLDVPATSFPARADYGRYLAAVLEEARAASSASFRHLRARATRLVDGVDGLGVTVDATSEPLLADAVVLATGNTPPSLPSGLEPMRGDPRLVASPWAPAALDPVVDGETVLILGTGHTALDLAASVLRRHPAASVVAVSRRGELPRAHEDPWRPRLPEPIFDVATFRTFADPLAEAEAQVRAHGDDWRRALDSLRPIHQQLWLAMDGATRRRFTSEWRRTWELHRSRVPAEVMRAARGWIAEGRLTLSAGTIADTESHGSRVRVRFSGAGDPAATLAVDRILLAIGPDERPASNPLLAAGIEDGLLRADELELGPDVDPATGRVRDAAGSTARPIWAMGPLRRGAVWECIAIPEIRDQAARLAEELLGPGPA